MDGALTQDSRTDHNSETADMALADQLDIDSDQSVPDTETLQSLVDQLKGPISPLVSSVLEALVTTIDHLQTRVADLEATLDSTHDVATTAVGDAAANASRLDDIEAEQSKTHDVAKSAIAKAQQLDADADHQTDAETLPEGVEPSSSPLDFFANCRQQTLKQVFVEQSNRQNTYRAIAVAKRWPEFATERTDGSGVFLTKDDVEDALLAELGRTPHRQTIARVWDTLQELGGTDLVQKTRQVGRRQTQTEILAIDMETAEGLLEQRYVGLDLLAGSAGKVTTGGVTPVVTGGGGATV
ncbi:hypothetical protein [Haloarcula sp. JP-L23]|uniref:hypothetical protein n=1 Tax=Haloarcula sp. JP-L23 TaxID=2716717 RepID=UPI00140F3A6E|nr:hypothetical protein G9465_22235 [Haloarcula sp. JP-L23]